MKQTLLALLLVLTPGAVHAQDLTLAGQMRAMGELLAQVQDLASDPDRHPQAAIETREVREHLVQAIRLVPQKAVTLTGADRDSFMLDFQQTMARMINMSCLLERALIDPTYVPSAINADQEIRNLLKEITNLMSEAQRKFC